MPKVAPQTHYRSQLTNGLNCPGNESPKGILRSRRVSEETASTKKQILKSDVAARIKGILVSKSKTKRQKVTFKGGKKITFENTPEDDRARKGAYNKDKSKMQREKEEKEVRVNFEQDKLSDVEGETIVNTRLAELGFCYTEPENSNSSAKVPPSAYMVLKFRRGLEARSNQRIEKLDILKVRLSKLEEETEILWVKFKKKKVTDSDFAKQFGKLGVRAQKISSIFHDMRKEIDHDSEYFKLLENKISKDRKFFESSGARKHISAKARNELELGLNKMQMIVDHAKQQTPEMEKFSRELAEAERRMIVNDRLYKLGFWYVSKKELSTTYLVFDFFRKLPKRLYELGCWYFFQKELSSTYMAVNFGRNLAEKLDPSYEHKWEKANDLEEPETGNCWNAFVEARDKQRNEELNFLKAELSELEDETQTLRTDREKRAVTNGEFAERFEALDKRKGEVWQRLHEIRTQFDCDVSSFLRLKDEIKAHRTFFEDSKYCKDLTKNAVTELVRGFLEIQQILDQAIERAKVVNEFIVDLENRQVSLVSNLMPLKNEVTKIRSRKPVKPKFDATNLKRVDEYFKARSIYDNMIEENYKPKQKAYETLLEKRQLDEETSEDNDLHLKDK